MGEIIRVDGLKKYFRDIKAVDGISFSVEEGEVFGFLGVNGAGKSTTINMLCTLYRPTGGRIEIAGYRIGRDDAAIRNAIGVVWQENCLDDLLSVRENLEVRGGLYGLKGVELRYNIAQIGKEMQLEDIMDRTYERLSGGQKRRCEIAAALVHRPKILFLDEPTTGLDPAARQMVWENVDALRRKNGTTIFLTTHYMEEAAKAGHIAIIDGGKIKEFGTPYALKKKYTRDRYELVQGTMDEVFLKVTGKYAEVRW